MKLLKRIFSVILILCFVSGGIYLGNRVTERTVSRQKYIKFFSEQKEYDVLFYGSSHVLSGIQPMEIWDKYGITSYNLAGHAASLGMSYWVLRESLRYHKPKLAVLDIYDMYAFDQPFMDVSFMHYSLDAYPLDRLKVEAVRDLLRGRSTGEKTELLFPFSVYHSRWNEVTEQSLKESFSDDYFNPYYGSEARYGVAVPMDIDRVPALDVTEGSDGADDYIRGFVKVCEDAGVQVCFMRVPYPASVENQRAENRVMKLAEELGIEVIDMMYDVEGVSELADDNDVISGVDEDQMITDNSSETGEDTAQAAGTNEMQQNANSSETGEDTAQVAGTDETQLNADSDGTRATANNGKLSSTVVDWDTDLVDPNAHLNAYGAYKVSLFLGEWLKRVYGFTDKREDPDYANWNEDFERVYIPALNTDLKLQSDFKTCLMLSAYPEYETELQVTSLYKPDDVCEKLIKEHGGLIKISSFGETIENSILEKAETEFGIADSGGRNEASESFILEPGQIACYYDLDGQTLGTEPDASTLSTPVARILVKLRDTGEVVADKIFLQ
ncbi:MAG: hypothetical protein J6N70_06840 [Oribacterium sp.]|nr:hypothetical protein [Oribacterium sp.]